MTRLNGGIAAARAMLALVGAVRGRPLWDLVRGEGALGPVAVLVDRDLVAYVVEAGR
ncbi:hypothetical protein [Actinoallomurus acaciae]|uniref:Uncharacterized protein n=1 Tax=Actinoallomurus acaciae TaxID=502577 RepID=A0ABV5YKF9_9ACTN